MSVKTIEAVFLRVRGISCAERIVLVYLAHRLNDETGECFPTEVRISEDTELDVRTVKKAIAALEKQGLVSRTIRKTKGGNGRSYAVHVPNEVINSPMSVGGTTPPSNGAVGGVDAVRRWSPRSQLVVALQSVGGATPPDNNRKINDSVCDREAHTHEVVDNSKGGGAGSSPFGIYDVEDAVRRLSVGDNPVPPSFIEDRARTLTADGGVLAKGGKVTAEAFVAHCRTWWENERDKGRYLAPASAPKSKGGFPLAKRGEDKEAHLCGEAGCTDCVDGHICGKGYVPPNLREGYSCHPTAKTIDGKRYLCGCFRPKDGSS